MNLQQRIFVGASTRAAAMSALRRGITPWCIDLFGDLDLRRIAQVQCCPFDEYPQGLIPLLEQAPEVPWSYTGGLENYPGLISELQQIRPLIGNSPDVLRQVRDPFRLQNLAQWHPFRFPKVSWVPQAKKVLRKPFRGSSGTGISFASERTSGTYFQEFREGISWSAVFREGELLGVSIQLIGEAFLNAAPFQYCGSIGLSSDTTDEMMADHLADIRYIAQILREETGLHEDFGLDLILDDVGVSLIEVNPRYTASFEIAERIRLDPSLTDRVPAKAILFAPCDLTIPEHGPWMEELQQPFDVGRFPEYADIPAVGERILKGWPILTFFVEGADRAECMRMLRERAAYLLRLLNP